MKDFIYYKITSSLLRKFIIPSCLLKITLLRLKKKSLDFPVCSVPQNAIICSCEIVPAAWTEILLKDNFPFEQLSIPGIIVTIQMVSLRTHELCMSHGNINLNKKDTILK